MRISLDPCDKEAAGKAATGRAGRVLLYEISLRRGAGCIESGAKTASFIWVTSNPILVCVAGCFGVAESKGLLWDI
jgi:hypothetical protein